MKESDFKTYKMCAECQFDIGQMLGKFYIRHMVLESDVFPGVTVTFQTFFDLQQIQKFLATVADGHVMLETVQLEKNFTGDRNSLTHTEPVRHLRRVK